jgi:general secretion pathway protein L
MLKGVFSVSNRLMIRYDSDDFTHWSWIPLDKNNRPIGEAGSGDLNALATDAKGKRLVLVIAGRSLLITTVELPDGNQRTISSAIPYAMEEQMAEDVEYMHFARGKRQADGMIPVVAISKQYLKDLLIVLAEADLYPTWAVAEPLLLPWDENELTILLNDTAAIVRNGETSGFECSLKQLPLLLERLPVNEDENSQIIRVWNKSIDVDVSHLLQADDKQLLVEQSYSDFDQLTELGSKWPTINLLQGFDQQVSPQSSFGSWWPAIAMSLLAITVYLGTSVYHYYDMQQEIKSITQKSEELFRKTFPEVKRIVKPLVQAQQKLDQRKLAHGQGEDDLLALLYTLGQARKKISTIKFTNLEYRQQTLVIQLEGKNVALIEKFKQQLESDGRTTSDILSTVSKGEKVEARIKIKANSA